MISELELQAKRLEQQLAAFEKLHADDLQRFEEQLATYRRLQNDEIQMLREQLQQFKSDIASLKERGASSGAAASPNQTAVPVELTVTRRDVITGNIPPFKPMRP